MQADHGQIELPQSLLMYLNVENYLKPLNYFYFLLIQFLLFVFIVTVGIVLY